MVERCQARIACLFDLGSVVRQGIVVEGSLRVLTKQRETQEEATPVSSLLPPTTLHLSPCNSPLDYESISGLQTDQYPLIQSCGTRPYFTYMEAKESRKECDTSNKLKKPRDKLQDEIMLYVTIFKTIVLLIQHKNATNQ